jgi:hypothetical protein
LRGSFHLNDHTGLRAMVYARKVDTRSFNGDDSEAEVCEADDDILCEEDGNQEVIIDQNGNPIWSEYDAVNNIGKRRQRVHGGKVQRAFSQDIAGTTTSWLTDRVSFARSGLTKGGD